ncbi:hypothetical protein ACJHXG_18125, partial [Escherichia sp. WS500]
QNDVTLKMPAFEWVHVQLHQQKGMISLSPPTICNSALRCFQPTTRNIARNVTDNPSNACCYPDAAGNIAFGFNNMHDLR